MIQEGRQNQEPLGKAKAGEDLRSKETESRGMALEVGKGSKWTEPINLRLLR